MKHKEIDGIAYRLKLYQIRSKLQFKGVLYPVKEMIKQEFWVRTLNDNNYISGRTLNQSFIEAIEKFNNSIN